MPMPPAPAGVSYTDFRARYSRHADELLKFCSQPPPDGAVVREVNFVDDGRVLSPPIVFKPLYTCARGVSVGGAVLEADVDLYLNGARVDTVRAGLGAVAFTLPADLRTGDVLKATQSFGGTTSAFSDDALVAEYPDSVLPKPVIDPDTVYACADSILVRTVPGAYLEAFQNGSSPEWRYTQGEWARMGPGPKPWDFGDNFSVSASLCSKRSPVSDVVVAKRPPASLRAPSFNPPEVFAGQDALLLSGLDYGSFARMSRVTPVLNLGHSGGAPGGSVSYQLSASALGRTLQAGETLRAEPSLFCPTGPPGTPTTTGPALPCNSLPPPRIAFPIAGESEVSVLSSIPGARIRLYDASRIEIADGAGTRIRLTPPRRFVLGDVITAVQQVGACVGTTGYEIKARPGEG